MEFQKLHATIYLTTRVMKVIWSTTIWIPNFDWDPLSFKTISDGSSRVL